MNNFKIVEDVSIPRSSAKAFMLKKGQVFRVSIPECGTVGDFVAFNAANLKERFDQARTKVDNGKIFLSKGDKLYSKSNNVMFTIIEDTYGFHDLQYGVCSQWVFENVPVLQKMAIELCNEIPQRGCWENLTDALKPWNIDKEDIPSPLNIFMKVAIDAVTGKMTYLPDRPRRGDYIDLKAEMDCLVAISNSPIFCCPLRLQVLEPLE